MLRRKAKPRGFFGIELELLPDSIRYANAHNGAQLNRKHVESLFEKGRENMKRLGFYLAMKAANDDDAIQVKLLRRAVDLNFNLEALTKDDIAESMDHLDSKDNPTVPGGKLAQVSRHGFRAWPDRFDQVLGPYMDVENPPKLFMLANSTYIGIDAIAKHTVQRGQPLGILIPERTAQAERNVGFRIEPSIGGIAISGLDHGFERPERALIFDDVINTGSARNGMMQYWGETEAAPVFVAAIKSGGKF